MMPMKTFNRNDAVYRQGSRVFIRVNWINLTPTGWENRPDCPVSRQLITRRVGDLGKGHWKSPIRDIVYRPTVKIQKKELKQKAGIVSKDWGVRAHIERRKWHSIRRRVDQDMIR